LFLKILKRYLQAKSVKRKGRFLVGPITAGPFTELPGEFGCARNSPRQTCCKKRRTWKSELICPQRTECEEYACVLYN